MSVAAAKKKETTKAAKVTIPKDNEIVMVITSTKLESTQYEETQ